MRISCKHYFNDVKGVKPRYGGISDVSIQLSTVASIPRSKGVMWYVEEVPLYIYCNSKTGIMSAPADTLLNKTEKELDLTYGVTYLTYRCKKCDVILWDYDRLKTAVSYFNIGGIPSLIDNLTEINGLETISDLKYIC